MIVRLVTAASIDDLRFEPVHDDRVQAQVRVDLGADLRRLFRAAASGWVGFDTHAIADGRGGSVIIWPAGAPRILVRRYMRGGLPSRFVRDTYLGFRPRPFRELSIMKMLYENGAQVPEPCGAAVQWLFPGCYRGWLATRFIDRAPTLWRWLRDESPTAEQRRAVFDELKQAIRKVRSLGVQHVDLNLHNVLVCLPSNRVVLIDFDRARQGTRDENDLRAELKRLRRSAKKLDPDRRVITEKDLLALRAE